MIVSHRHRFVFFAVPRTGTHAIRAALADDLGPDDWRQEALAEQVRLPVAALAELRHGHITLREATAHLPAACGGYFKFAFVRHPFDRFVSACAMLNRRNAEYPGRERQFMARALAVPRFRARALVRPQTAMLKGRTGELGMDYIGRYETLQASFDEVCETLGIAHRRLRVRNAAPRSTPVERILDHALAATLLDFYREDFELLGYEAPACA